MAQEREATVEGLWFREGRPRWNIKQPSHDILWRWQFWCLWHNYRLWYHYGSLHTCISVYYTAISDCLTPRLQAGCASCHLYVINVHKLFLYDPNQTLIEPWFTIKSFKQCSLCTEPTYLFIVTIFLYIHRCIKLFIITIFLYFHRYIKLFIVSIFLYLHRHIYTV